MSRPYEPIHLLLCRMSSRLVALSLGLSRLVALTLGLLVLVPTALTLGHVRRNQQFSDDIKAQEKDPIRPLEPGKPIERELAGGSVHSYSLTLAAGQFCEAVVDQKGIDVVVSLYDTNRQKIVQVDSPNADYGPELVRLVADASGEYRLEVQSLDKHAQDGRYVVKIIELRASTPQDQGRVAAQKASVDAKSLRDLRTGESQRQAIEKYKESLALWQTLADQRMQAYTLHEMGFIYGDLGDYQKAIDAYTRARVLYKAMGDPSGEGGVLNNLGWIYGTLGDYQKAIDFHEQALRTPGANREGHEDTRVLNNIGANYASLGNYQKALDIHLQILKIRHSRNDLGGQAITLNNIANCYEHLGEKQKALDYYGQALTFMPSYGNAFYTATTLNHIGTLYRDLGQPDKALEYLNQALTLRRTVGDQNGEAATLSDIARLERDRGNLEEARKHIEAALAAVEILRANVTSQQLRASFFASVRTYHEFEVDLLMRLNHEHPDQGFDAAAFEASERGRARSLLELLNEASAEIRQGVDTRLVQRERSLRQEISEKAVQQRNLLSGKHSAEQATTAARELENLTTEYEQVQSNIRQSSPRYAALMQPVPLSLKEIQAQLLDENTLLLEYELGQEQSFAWAITRTSMRSFTLPKHADIEGPARRVYDLVTAADRVVPNETAAQTRKRLEEADAEYPVAAATLSRILLDPVASELKNKRLVIVGEGVLQYVPFAALPEPSSAASVSGGQNSLVPPTPLIVDHEIVSLPSASVLGVLRREAADRQAPNKTVAVFADPVFELSDSRLPFGSKTRPKKDETPLNGDLKRSAEESGLYGFPRLRFSRQEAEQIVRLASKEQSLEALDFSASRASASSAELDRYRIVHFATHGMINSQHPDLSGIVLSLVNEKGEPQNGFLRLIDIYNLNLKADLVVLSACQTALGKDIKGEGLVGLSRAFMYAGATRVIATLWQTEDRASANLMGRFYESMLADHVSPSRALRDAQIFMWQSKRWQHPRYWAAFTLQGDWK